MASDEKNSQRFSKAKQLFEKRKECLKEEIARAERLEHPYDDLFSSGEKIEMRNLWVAVRSL